MKNETVYCKDCGLKLAWWDMFTNIQYEEEWECPAKFRRSIKNCWRSKDKKSRLHSSYPDEKHTIPVKTEINNCSLIYNTKYCRKCAEKRHFKCGRPKCKGHLVKVRNKDGSSTKHTHGGW